MKRVGLGSTGWALVQSKEGGGTPVMGAVCEMGGERRLGVGVEHELIGGALFAKQVLREVGCPQLVLFARWVGKGVCGGHWAQIDMGHC